MEKKIKAAFFDRDDTLIKNVSYLSKVEDIDLIPGIIEFCTALQRDGYYLFVVTNQSGIARGYFDEECVQKIHDYLDRLFRQAGVLLTAFLYCPHHPEIGSNVRYTRKCLCRKPAPGMLINASEKFYINLYESLMFGDKETDIIAGHAAGCRSFYIQNALLAFAGGSFIWKI